MELTDLGAATDAELFDELSRRSEVRSTGARPADEFPSDAGLAPPLAHFGTGGEGATATSPLPVASPPSVALHAQPVGDGTFRVRAADPSQEGLARSISDLLAWFVGRPVGSLSPALLDVALKVEQLEEENRRLRALLEGLGVAVGQPGG